MCQKNNIQKRFTAGTICYKVLRNSFVYGYLSIYHRTLWRLGCIHTTCVYNHKLKPDIVKDFCSSSGSIGPGFFHAFPTLEEAMKFQKTISGPSFGEIITKYPIAEMRIPEDTDGFSGTYFDNGGYFDSITVPILEFVKIVDQNVPDK